MTAGDSPYWRDREVLHAIRDMEARITHKLEKIMAGQDSINTADQAIVGLLTDMAGDISTIGTAVTAIQAALAALPASVDTTQLDADVAKIADAQTSLDAAASSVAGVVPPAPAS